MSSTRRTANEINILAMLDRHEAAGLPRRLLRRLRGLPAAVWYGTAGVLVCALVGVLAWLARDGDSVDSALAGAVTVKPAAAIAAAPPGPLTHAASDAPPEPEPEPAAGAAIVDVAPAPAPEPAAPLHAQQEQAGHITPSESARDPERVSAHAAAAKSTSRAAAGKAGASGSRAAALAHAEPRHKRPAVQPKAKAALAPVDTDVDLISAIIQHASKRQEAEDAARNP